MTDSLGINYDPQDIETREGEVEIEIDLAEYLDLSDMDIKVKAPVEYAPGHIGHEHYFENKVITGELIKWFMDQMFGAENGVPDEIIKRKPEIERKIEAAVEAGKTLKFRLPIAAEYAVGSSWLDTH